MSWRAGQAWLDSVWRLAGLGFAGLGYAGLVGSLTHLGGTLNKQAAS